ncbi:Ig-like domain repeat protein [Pedococcus sp. KACC 23699]|uniref:Ig-like domain repeat protein n=1 Tax=Pedococcus sp. KACC 23699 TaxID=3149228 RepID=A0AAU7JRG0_9MICO
MPRSTPPALLPGSRARAMVHRSTATLAVVATALTTTVAVTAGAASAAPLTTTLFEESFTATSTSQPTWTLPPAPGGNRSCLTAGTTTTPIPSCNVPAIDPSGGGALRLTPSQYSAVGSVFYDAAMPSAQGIDVTFDSYQWGMNGGHPGDGISFVLAATDPSNPSAPATTGPPGGALGYTGDQNAPGLPHGYLGFGLDTVGGFGDGAYTGGCPSTSPASPSVAVRGPGNGSQGYCVLGVQSSNGPLDQPYNRTRPSAPVPVEVVLNPSTTEVTSRGGVSVPAQSWMVAWTPYDTAQRQSMSGLLPSQADLAAAALPQSWYDPQTGVPYQLTFGVAGSTGAWQEVHEVANMRATTLTGQLPVYQLAVTDDSEGSFTSGRPASVMVTPSLSATAGDETRPATVTTTLPDGLVPTNPTVDGYACTTQDQVVACTTTGAGYVAGSQLPSVTIPVTPGSDFLGRGSISAKVSSTDGNPASERRDVTVRSPQSVTFTTTSPTTPLTGGRYDVAAAGGASGNPVTITVDPSTAGNCTLDGGTVTFTHASDCVLVASQAGTEQYLPGTAEQRITVGPDAQAITFDPLTTPAVVGAVQRLAATGGGSGNPVTFAIDPTTTGDACTLADGVLSFTHAGDCVVTADQAGNADWTAAPPVLQTVAVDRAATGLSVAPRLARSVYGQPVTAKATVTGTTGGTVQFILDGSPVGSAVPVGSDGTATSGALAPARDGFLAVGAHQLSAVLTPADPTTHARSTANAQAITVDKAATTASVHVGPTALTATLQVPAPGSGVPTGAVVFSVDGAPVGSAAVVGGVARLAYATPADKDRRVSAAYSGDARFLASSASTARSNPAITARVTSAQGKSRYGWYRTPVTVTFACTTHGASLTAACPAPVTLTASKGGQSVSRTVTAADGGIATVTVGGINLDRVAPRVAVTGVRSGGRYFAGTPGARCSVNDGLSGIASCTLTRVRRGERETITATALDKAGNAARTTVSVTVPTIMIKDAPFANGVYTVRRGHTYTLMVSSPTRPRYVDAAVYPKAPRGHDKYFKSIGRNQWALGVTMDRPMRSGYWNLGVKIGTTVHPVKVRVTS